MVRRLSITIACTIVVVAAALIGNVVAGNKPALGLDLQGGASITLQPVGDYTAAALEKAVEIIERRVNSLGVAEPEITRQGDNVVVNLPRFNWEERNIYAATPAVVPYYPIVAYRVMQNPATGLDALQLIPDTSTGASYLRVWYYPNPKNSAYSAGITNPKGSPIVVLTPGTYYNVSVNGGSGTGMKATVVIKIGRAHV